MKKLKQIVLNKHTATACVFILLFIALKAHEFASAPTKAKACDFVYPNNIDQTKPTTITAVLSENHVSFKQKGGFMNDASCLNKTAVYGIARIFSVEDVQNALAFARENNLKVTSSGQQHSMGGQSFVKNGLILDMKGLKEMQLNKEQKVLTVQSGATWADVQQFLDKQGLAVKAMQSINIFTVGGTLSVNAHGIAHNPGQIAPTVKSMRIMLSNGEIKTASPLENPELFKLALGGYGLFGVILDANIEVVDNELYDWKTRYMNYKDFPSYYSENIEGNENVGLFYARISVSPTSYLTEIAAHEFLKTKNEGAIPPIIPDEHTALQRFVINFSKTGSIGRFTRWMLEKQLVPSASTCISRNQAMSQKEVCLISRNQKMYDSMKYLKNKLKDTDILQEYFIPQEKMPDFVDGLRSIVKEDGANLLNVTIRIVHKDTVTALPYAKEDMFAFVLYFNQKLNEKESKMLQKTTTDLIDLATGLNGTYYLPYQLYYSQEQLQKAYPEIDHVFAVKKIYDPTELFSNTFYEKYKK